MFNLLLSQTHYGPKFLLLGTRKILMAMNTLVPKLWPDYQTKHSPLLGVQSSMYFQNTSTSHRMPRGRRWCWQQQHCTKQSKYASGSLKTSFPIPSPKGAEETPIPRSCTSEAGVLIAGLLGISELPTTTISSSFYFLWERIYLS